MPYIQDAEREGDDELADLFRPAKRETGKGASRQGAARSALDGLMSPYQ